MRKNFWDTSEWQLSLRKRMALKDWPGWSSGFTLVVFDWSIRRGILALIGGTEWATFPNLLALLDHLRWQGNYLIVGEATFSSFDLNQRVKFMTRVQEEGHLLLTVANRMTPRRVRQYGTAMEGLFDEFSGDYRKDRQDVQAMFWSVRDGAHLAPPAPCDSRRQALRKAANKQLLDLRRSGELTPRPRSAGYSFTSAKDLYARQLCAQLPPYSSLDPVRKLALGDGKEYNLVVLAAAGVATEHSGSRADFDYLTGMYDHAYPSQLRADLHHYVWAGGNTRAKLEDRGHGPRKDGLTLTQYRSSLRWLYAQLKGMAYPATGISNP